MAQGDVLQIDVKIQIDGDGKIRLVNADSDCPGCCGCTDDLTGRCSNCDDITPDVYRVIFSIILACGCYEMRDEPGRYLSYTLNFNPNSAFDLHRIPGTGNNRCQWSYGDHAGAADPPLTVDWSVYDNALCAGASLASRTNVAVTLLFNKEPTQHNLYMAFPANYVIGSTGFGGLQVLFVDCQDSNTNGIDQLCATVPSFVNDSVSCGGDPNTACILFGANATLAATGGAATVVCP